MSSPFKKRVKSLQKILVCSLLLLFIIIPVTGKAIDGTSNLHQVGTIPLSTYFNSISDNTLYTGEGNAIRCYDISPGINLSAITYRSFNGQIFFEEPITGMNITKGKLYVTTSNILYVASLADKLHPVELGSIYDTDYNLRDVRVVGNFAYVGGTPRLSVFDISNPANPTFVRDIKEPAAHGYGIWRLGQEGNYLYGGYANENLVSIWDISSAGNPVYVSNTTVGTGSGVQGLAYRNNILYVANYNTKLITYDVTDRSNPRVIDTKNFTSGYGPVDVQVVGNYLYVSVRYNGIRIYDISTPIPVLVGTKKTNTGYTEQISSNGHITAVSRFTSGTMIYDTTTKTAPTIITNINTPSESFALEAQTLGTLDVLALGGRNMGNWYWNITDPETASTLPPLADFGSQFGNPREYVIPWYGNYSYATMGANGAKSWIVNLTGIETPGFVPKYVQYNPESNIVSFYITDSRIYTGTMAHSLRIFDNTLKDTAVPEEISSTKPLGGNFFGQRFVPYKTNYLISKGTDYKGGLHLINITNERAPTEEFWFDPPLLDKKGNVSDTNTYSAYYYNETSGIIVALQSAKKRIVQIDVSDISNWHYAYPNFSLPVDFVARNMAMNGTDLFACGRGTPNILMYSMENPERPRLVDSLSTMDRDSRSVEFYKGYLYTGSEQVMTIIHITPSSSKNSQLSQQTYGSQNQKQIQPHESSGVADQTVFTQIAGLWNKFVSYFYRYFPVHL